MSHRSWIQIMSSLALLMLVGLAAQDKPDFSGRWVLRGSLQAGPDAPKALSVRQALVRTNVRGEPTKPFFKDIAVEREFDGGGTRSETYVIGIVGGIVPGLREDGTRNGANGYHGVNWDGDALVFESGTYTGQARETGAWTDRREVWSLDGGGQLRVVVTTRGSTDAPRAVTLLFRRR